ncbi:hypothetical protein EJ08DRAFT_697109 [Tothia fuscella]|uniref:Uncharacterized protein n=1 Tax=Tothia fuscella TaxID=1048955 RepID=A0A9P4TYS9_9PEZI|nr:hypothetical protein EJ08DRAFT_697109 [Tothia fuscella]
MATKTTKIQGSADTEYPTNSARAEPPLPLSVPLTGQAKPIAKPLASPSPINIESTCSTRSAVTTSFTAADTTSIENEESFQNISSILELVQEYTTKWNQLKGDKSSLGKLYSAFKPLTKAGAIGKVCDLLGSTHLERAKAMIRLRRTADSYFQDLEAFSSELRSCRASISTIDDPLIVDAKKWLNDVLKQCDQDTILSSRHHFEEQWELTQAMFFFNQFADPDAPTMIQAMEQAVGNFNANLAQFCLMGQYRNLSELIASSNQAYPNGVLPREEDREVHDRMQNMISDIHTGLTKANGRHKGFLTHLDRVVGATNLQKANWKKTINEIARTRIGPGCAGLEERVNQFADRLEYNPQLEPTPKLRVEENAQQSISPTDGLEDQQLLKLAGPVPATAASTAKPTSKVDIGHEEEIEPGKSLHATKKVTNENKPATSQKRKLDALDEGVISEKPKKKTKGPTSDTAVNSLASSRPQNSSYRGHNNEPRVLKANENLRDSKSVQPSNESPRPAAEPFNYLAFIRNPPPKKRSVKDDNSSMPSTNDSTPANGKRKRSGDNDVPDNEISPPPMKRNSNLSVASKGLSLVDPETAKNSAGGFDAGEHAGTGGKGTNPDLTAGSGRLIGRNRGSKYGHKRWNDLIQRGEFEEHDQNARAAVPGQERAYRSIPDHDTSAKAQSARHWNTMKDKGLYGRRE